MLILYLGAAKSKYKNKKMHLEVGCKNPASRFAVFSSPRSLLKESYPIR